MTWSDAQKIVTDIFHRTDSFRINLAGWSRPGAVSFDLVSSMNARECFCHLAAVGILDTEKANASVLKPGQQENHSCALSLFNCTATSFFMNEPAREDPEARPDRRVR